MDNESDLEKTEQPSQRRLDQAHEEGQVARSRELSTFMALLAGGGGLWFMGEHLRQSLLRLVRQGLSFDAGVATDPVRMMERFSWLSLETVEVFLPFLGLLLVTAIFSPLLLNGWLFSFKPLQPNFSRLDPLAGIGRMFSAQGGVELGKSIAKAGVVGGAGVWAVWHYLDQTLMLPALSLPSATLQMGTLVGNSFLAMLAGMMLVAAVDVPFQLWEHNRRLRMTKDEIRQESKETEGDPQIKGKIRTLQRERARRRMMAQIPTADVVVTNPTHYAVVLRYQEGVMRAPIVVAKGVHLVAERIRSVAATHRIPVVEAPALARALYAHTELEHPVPEALYLAVAEILAYAYQLQRQRKEGGGVPHPPQNLPVPVELDPENRVSPS
ncbi:MAG: flagellar type III secretion system protein FlhB [Ferrovum sp.]|jgi:flagellar biosynthetic protein FlhB|nr:flagellar type III secretion system protein FlhB [Ferrovum sp.]NDU88546.1 flagellar type III secretion system protein FlhB [Ferrovum sp.]